MIPLVLQSRRALERWKIMKSKQDHKNFATYLPSKQSLRHHSTMIYDSQECLSILLAPSLRDL